MGVGRRIKRLGGRGKRVTRQKAAPNVAALSSTNQPPPASTSVAKGLLQVTLRFYLSDSAYSAVGDGEPGVCLSNLLPISYNFQEYLKVNLVPRKTRRLSVEVREKRKRGKVRSRWNRVLDNSARATRR